MFGAIKAINCDENITFPNECRRKVYAISYFQSRLIAYYLITNIPCESGHRRSYIL